MSKSESLNRLINNKLYNDCLCVLYFSNREKNAPKLDMVSNRTTGPGAIRFDVMVTANIYVLNEEEVPTLTTIGSDVLTVGQEIFHK